MHKAFRGRIGLSAVAVIAIVSASFSGGVATAAPRPTTKAPSAAVETRLVAQQGLAIGLASNVLQSQLTVLDDAEDGVTVCSKSTSGVGSSKVLHETNAGQVATVDVDVYYDTKCAHPYVEADAKVTSSITKGLFGFSITETAVYLGTAGARLGSLTLTESAKEAASGVLDLVGTGRFTPKSGAPAVSLGLTCAVPASRGTPRPFPCSGGIAQSFPKLGVSTGSVTPLTLTLKAIGSDQYKVSFAGSKSTLETGRVGALSIATKSGQLVIKGKGTVVGTDTTSGQAGEFVLFPPTPTKWAITDKAHKTRFSVSVLNNASRKLSGSVATTSGRSLARFSLDRSGTGTFTYVGGSTVRVTNWLLAG
jgi:hypothetical protein